MKSEPDLIESPATGRNEVPSETNLPRIRSMRVECQAEIDTVNEQIEILLERRKLLERGLNDITLCFPP
jgi:hypothetical protein